MMILKHLSNQDNVVLARILLMQKGVSNQLNIDHKILYYQKKF